MIPRRPFLLMPALAACSVLPDRPFQESRRFTLAPERPGTAPPRPGAPVLLVRSFRAAPGLELRGLRSAGADGQVALEYWSEWAAPPADLAEEATRRWLAASGRFAAVTAPGSRVRADLVLEAELVRLQAEPDRGEARAGVAALLLAEPAAGGETRVLAQFLAEGDAPLAPRAIPAAIAAALSAALGAALAALEARLAGAIPARLAGAGGTRQ
jgi:ABC-type uncharacterized transport system auxiliary subunit